MGYELEDASLDRGTLRVYVYGLCMGTADALPGVSGGTVALLLGFYGRLIAAITAFTPRRAVTVVRGVSPGRRERARGALAELDLPFLLPLGVGMVTAVVFVAELVTVLEEAYPVALYGFFAGLIGASAIVLYRSLAIRSGAHVLAAVAGVAVALLIASGVIQLPGDGNLTIFLAGSLAVSAMILPGVSGSLILILLGQYVFLTGELSDFVRSIADLVGGGSLSAVLDPGTTVALFVAGGVLGLVTIARVVRAALARRRELTLVFLVSLIAGSTPAPLLSVGEEAAWTTETALVVIGWALVGALVLVALDRLAGGFDPE